jgi:hypothetical protein
MSHIGGTIEVRGLRAAVPSERGPVCPVGGKPAERGRELVGSVRGYDHAGVGAADELGSLAPGGEDDRPAGGHALEQLRR